MHFFVEAVRETAYTFQKIVNTQNLSSTPRHTHTKPTQSKWDQSMTCIAYLHDSFFLWLESPFSFFESTKTLFMCMVTGFWFLIVMVNEWQWIWNGTSAAWVKRGICINKYFSGSSLLGAVRKEKKVRLPWWYGRQAGGLAWMHDWRYIYNDAIYAALAWKTIKYYSYKNWVDFCA